jgi:hypothetical protein
MFTNYKLKRQKLEIELEMYEKRSKLGIDVKLEEYKKVKNAEMVQMAKQCAEELGQYEHDYHSTKEKLGIDLAKIEAKLEMYKQVIDANEKLVRNQEAEIKRYNEIINALIAKQPQSILQQTIK